MNEIVFQFTFSDRSTPVTVECLNLKKTVSVSCGERHTAVLTKVPSYSAFNNVVSSIMIALSHVLFGELNKKYIPTVKSVSWLTD